MNADWAALPARETIAVTGAGGFIGGRLVEMLEQTGHLQARPIGRRTIRLDDPARLGPLLAGCGGLVHCAFDAYDGPANLAIADAVGRACAAARIRLVHLSTAAIYEPLPDGLLTETAPTDVPGTAYKAIKHAVEERLLALVATHGLDLVILQPTIVYGPHGGAWTDSPVRELLTGELLLPDAGQGLCNAVYVDDVCQAAISACKAALPPGERLLVSGPAPVTWRDFLGFYEAMLGTGSLRLEPAGRGPVAIDPHPAPSGPAQALRRLVLGRLGAGGRSRLNLAIQRVRLRLRGRTVFRASGAKRALYEARCHVSTAKAARMLGYVPRFDLADGMAATRAYVQRVGRGAGRNPARSGIQADRADPSGLAAPPTGSAD